MLKILAFFFIIPLFARLYVMVYTLLKCGEHLYGRVIVLGGDVYTRKLVPVTNQESERSCISLFVVMYFCVCGITFASFYDFLWILKLSFSFGHCVVGPSSIYRFWLPLCYLQTILNPKYISKTFNVYSKLIIYPSILYSNIFWR